MSSIIKVPPSLPYLLERIEHWEAEERESECINYKTTCELIITELRLVADYAKEH